MELFIYDGRAKKRDMENWMNFPRQRELEAISN